MCSLWDLLTTSINHACLKAPRNKSKMLKNNDIMKLWPTLSRMIRHIVKGDVGELSFESCYFHAYMMVLYRTGDKLYNGACQIIRNHLAGLVKQKIIPALPTGASRGPAKQLQGEVLLNILAQIWNNHVERMSQLNQVLKYMVYLLVAVFFGGYKFDKPFFRIVFMFAMRKYPIFGMLVYELSASKSSCHQ